MHDENIPCQVTGLSVAYHDRLAVKNVTVSVPPGAVMAILGPNGAGKSTLLKAVMGLVPTLSGDVRLFGRDLARSRRRVAYMPQTAEVDWDFPTTVRDVVSMGTYGRLGWWRRPGADQRAVVEKAQEAAGISDLAERQISQLSGGQKQRTFVARTLAQEPDLYLMDEPFAGVDVASERAIAGVLDSLRQKGKTIVIVHHDLSTVRRLCTHSLLLSEGSLVSAGPLEESFTTEHLHRAYGLVDEALNPREDE